MRPYVQISVLGWTVLVAISASARYAKRSPFEAVRWPGTGVEVRVNDVWYSLVAIDRVSVADLLPSCDQEHDEKRQKRFEEELVRALSEMGHAQTPRERAPSDVSSASY